MSQSLMSYTAYHVPKINEIILDFLQAETSNSQLLSSMTYSIEAGGKRLRPLLVLATLDFFDVALTRGHHQVAGALEMIHTYSLIHDDLPAMDNDELRRGQPTNHVVYGEALAILAGDSLLTEAFHLLSVSEIENEMKLELLQRLAQGSGAKGMIAGQVADIEGESKVLSLADLQAVHRQKTGALIEFAIEAGSILSEQPLLVKQQLRVFAEHFGIAFQIKDDLLDVLGDEILLGKKVGMDQVMNKSTYTSLLGVTGAQEALLKHYNQALGALDCAKEMTNNTNQQTLLESLIGTLMV